MEKNNTAPNLYAKQTFSASSLDNNNSKREIDLRKICLSEYTEVLKSEKSVNVLF